MLFFRRRLLWKCLSTLRDAGGLDEASERRSADYMDSVMSKTPPTAKKAVGSGALVVTIAIIPPSKATTPTTAMLDRLT